VWKQHCLRAAAARPNFRISSMADQIIPIAAIRQSASKTFAAGEWPSKCPYLEGSDAREIWMQEYRRLAAEQFEAQREVA
jgi:hypothetical protein